MNARPVYVLVITAAITLAGAIPGASQGCETIEWRSPEPFGSSFGRVIFANGIFLAAAGHSHVATSTDGETWTLRRVTDSEVLLVYPYWDGSQFIVTAAYGRLYTSPDGVDWTMHQTSGYATITAVARKGATTVVAYQYGSVAASTDWQSWPVVYYSPNTIIAIAVSNSEFIAVGSPNPILRSTDGFSWSDVTPVPTPVSQLENVEWNGSQFLAVGTGGGTFRSIDGLLWQQAYVSMSTALRGIAWDGSRWVVKGEWPLLVYSSPDGSSWTLEADIEAPKATEGLAYGNGRYVIVGSFGVNLSSTDRVNWVHQYSGPYDHLNGVATSGVRLVAVGESGATVSSPTGRSWTAHPLPSAVDLHGVAWSGTEFLAVGETGALWASPDGVSWSERPIGGVVDTLYGVVSAADHVVVGGSGTIASSSDGLSWTTVASTVVEDLHAVAANGSVYVAVGDGGTIVTSPDATTWTQRASGTTRDLRTVLWDGSTFYATGRDGELVRSSDGISWTDGAPLTSPNGTTTHDLEHHLGTYVAANRSTGIMISSDMTSWTVSSEWDTFHALAPTNTGMVAVGLHGSIIGLECWGIIFADGFETGDLWRWSGSAP